MFMFNQYTEKQVLQKINEKKNISGNIIDLQNRIFLHHFFSQDKCYCLSNYQYVKSIINSLKNVVLNYFNTMELSNDNIMKYKMFKKLFYQVEILLIQGKCIIKTMFLILQNIKLLKINFNPIFLDVFILISQHDKIENL